MASVKLSALAAIALASITATDIVPMTDADAGTPTTYKMTMANVRSALLQAAGAGWTATDYFLIGGGADPGSGTVRIAQGTLAGASSPAINSTVTWNNAATTFTHILVNVTNTASNAASLFVDYQLAGSSQWKVTRSGAVTQAGGLTVTAGGLTVSAGTTAVQALTGTTGTFTDLVTITKTTEQLRVRYDATHYVATTVDATGTVTFATNPGGSGFLVSCNGTTKFQVYDNATSGILNLGSTRFWVAKVAGGAEIFEFAFDALAGAAPARATIYATNAGAYPLELNASSLLVNSTNIKFFSNQSPAAKQTVAGSRGGNAALQSLLGALATYGLITDNSVA